MTPRPFHGWYVVLAGFMLATSFGFFNAFGVFFIPVLNDFRLSNAATSLAPSLALMSSTVSTLVAGRMIDSRGPRIVGLVGAILLGSGFVLSSFASDVLGFYLYYGVIAGIGWGFVTNVGTVPVLRWFVKRRGMAVGISSSGSAVGMLVLPPLFQLLITDIGWRAAMAVSGVMAFLMMLVASAVVKLPDGINQMPYGQEEPSDPAANHARSSMEAIRSSTFWIVYSGYALGALCLVAFTIHVDPYSIKAGVAPALAAGALAIIGLGSVIARLGVGFVSERMGRMVTLSASYLLLSVGVLVLLSSRGLAVLYISSFLVGLGYGGFIATNLAATGDIFESYGLGSIMGVMASAFGVGGMLGPVFAGALYDTYGNYELVFAAIAAASLLASALVLGRRNIA